MKLSASFIRSMLASHSVLGLTAAALLYLICVSGTFSVLYPDFERWEQPLARETTVIDTAQIDTAIARALERETKTPDHVFVSLPSEDMPRVVVSAGDTASFVNDAGLGEKVDHEWTHFLVELHYGLSLPGIFGMTLVGVLGVMLLAMVVSGLLAHPNIFKDAFSFRMGGAKRLQQVDLHNRLSVWTSPFQLMIALTGAFIGLSQLFVLVTAMIFHGGDTQAPQRPFFLDEPAATGVAAPMAKVGPILQRFMETHPEVKPLSITVHEPATTAQSIEIGALIPRRVVWAEFYLYDPDGKEIDQAGWSNGDAGVQVYSSTYRLHFGHFAGLPMKIAYVLLGVAVCFVVASGVHIWLLRRSQKGVPAVYAHRLWVGTVWGVPLAITVSALVDLLAGRGATLSFWSMLAIVLVAGARCVDTRALSYRLRAALAVSAVLIVVIHAVSFGAASWDSAGLLVNASWLLLGATVIVSIYLQRRSGADGTLAVRADSVGPARPVGESST